MRFQEAYDGWSEGRLTQAEAALILGQCERSFRRHIERFEADAELEGLLDKRLSQISKHRASGVEVDHVVQLYKSSFAGWNVAHFHSKYKAELSGARSYSWLKSVLQGAGVVKACKVRGKHRIKRERMPMAGMMIHQDASTHRWVPEAVWDLVVREWRSKLEAPGVRYNYNELCPLTMGMLLRAVSGGSLAQFAQTQLWQPMGAESDASWLTDALGREYNCVGFAARLRDWARLGQLVAQQGEMRGRQIVSKAWLTDCASHGPQDAQVRYGTMRADMGYKNFFWHPRPGGTWLMMNGHHGQRVLVDRASQTVLVQTALSHEGPWQRELFALFEGAIATAG